MRIFDILVPLAITSLSASSATAFASNGLPDELILSGDNIITVEIDGRPTRLEVRPDVLDAPTVNPAVAKELAFKPGMFGYYMLVGPVKVLANSAVHRVNYGVKPEKQRVFWADRDVSTIAEGTISPATLPYKRVIFDLNPARATEQIYRYPLDNFGFLGRTGIGTTLLANEEKVQVVFSLIRDPNLVNAPTGNWIAKNYDGILSGPATSTVIYYGIERPTRAMTLRSPLPVGKITLSNIAVRVSDFGDATGIKEQEDSVAPIGSDSQEIIVVGKTKKKTELHLTIGRAVLGQCSKLIYDMEQRELRLLCAF